MLEYQSKLKEQRRSTGFVTTLVSATHEEEDFDRITYPENAITVERTHTIELVDVEAEAEAGGGGRSVQKIRTGSTEEFFARS